MAVRRNRISLDNAMWGKAVGRELAGVDVCLMIVGMKAVVGAKDTQGQERLTGRFGEFDRSALSLSLSWSPLSFWRSEAHQYVLDPKIMYLMIAVLVRASA